MNAADMNSMRLLIISAWPRLYASAIFVTSQGNIIFPIVPPRIYEREMNAVFLGYQEAVTTIYMGIVAPAKNPHNATSTKTTTTLVAIGRANRDIPARSIPAIDKAKGFPPLLIIGAMIRRERAMPIQKTVREVAVNAGDKSSSVST